MNPPASSSPEPRSAGAPSCRVCGSSATDPWRRRGLLRPLVADDLRITDARYGLTMELRRCRDCGFIFAEADELRDLTGLYSNLEDEAYENTQASRALQMRWVLGYLRSLLPEARSLLDVGAGAGLLVSEARRAGLSAWGIEPSRALAAAARRLHGVDLLTGTLPHPALAGRRFDLVTLIDVIEHVSEPLTLLRQCRDHLTERGLLAVVTPDVGSLVARLAGSRWWHFRLAHIGYFSARSFEAAARRTGLRLVSRRRARWFFPVSYLAERVGTYLPVAWLNRLATRTAPGRWAYARVLPVNLADSYLFVVRRTEP